MSPCACVFVWTGEGAAWSLDGPFGFGFGAGTGRDDCVTDGQCGDNIATYLRTGVFEHPSYLLLTHLHTPCVTGFGAAWANVYTFPDLHCELEFQSVPIAYYLCVAGAAWSTYSRQSVNSAGRQGGIIAYIRGLISAGRVTV
ncbi:hypothetical protein FKP32DRAFT_1431186 [Trametes sanguinea]|nr:hypothetical protein FKP32DRAFT_1431186 [Trametes sanguinea]